MKINFMVFIVPPIRLAIFSTATAPSGPDSARPQRLAEVEEASRPAGRVGSGAGQIQGSAPPGAKVLPARPEILPCHPQDGRYYVSDGVGLRHVLGCLVRPGFRAAHFRS